MKNTVIHLIDTIIECALQIKDIYKQDELNRPKFIAIDFNGQNEKVVEPKKGDNDDMKIKLKDASVTELETPSGCYWKIRYRRNGFSKSFMSKTKKIAIEKFNDWASVQNDKLNLITGQRKPNVLTFEEWSKKALEIKRPLVKAISFNIYPMILKNYLLPAFGDKPISAIKAIDVQTIVNNVYKSGTTRILEDIKNVSNFIFEEAYKNDLIAKNPIKLVTFPKHHRTNGQALTIEEERELKEKISGNYYEPAILFMLYSGCRRAEVVKLTNENFDLENNVVKIECAKVKGRTEKVFRIIPLFPYLKEVVIRFWERPNAYAVHANKITKTFHDITDKKHHLHELKHTFVSRCKECGVNKEVVSTWASHDFEGVQKRKERGRITSTVYTHFSMEFQQKEALKITYLDKNT